MDIGPLAWNGVAIVIAGAIVFLLGARLSRRRRWNLLAGTSLALAALSAGCGPVEPPAKFIILVADLDGDAGKAQTNSVVQALQTQFADAIKRGALQVIARGEVLRPAGNEPRPQMRRQSRAGPGSSKTMRIY